MFQERSERDQQGNKFRRCGQRVAHKTQGRIRNTKGLQRNPGDHVGDHGNGDGKDDNDDMKRNPKESLINSK